jgi:hypothetical protein
VVNVPRPQLPKDVKEGEWLMVEFDGEKFITAEANPEETENARKRIMDKLERLRKGEHRTG